MNIIINIVESLDLSFSKLHHSFRSDTYVTSLQSPLPSRTFCCYAIEMSSPQLVIIGASSPGTFLALPPV